MPLEENNLDLCIEALRASAMIVDNLDEPMDPMNHAIAQLEVAHIRATLHLADVIGSAIFMMDLKKSEAT